MVDANSKSTADFLYNNRLHRVSSGGPETVPGLPKEAKGVTGTTRLPGTRLWLPSAAAMCRGRSGSLARTLSNETFTATGGDDSRMTVPGAGFLASAAPSST